MAGKRRSKRCAWGNATLEMLAKTRTHARRRRIILGRRDEGIRPARPALGVRGKVWQSNT